MTKSAADEFSGPVTKKRRRKEPTLPPCRICGSKATGYHYGVIACAACKTFFRRSIHMKTPYKCKGNDQCLIKPDQSVPCSYCRFQKCLELGMSVDGIRMGRYTIKEKTTVVQEVRDREERLVQEKETAAQRQTEKEAELQALADAALEADMQYPLVQPEILKDVPMEQRKYKEMKTTQENLYGSMKPVPHNMYEHLLYTFGLEVDDRREKVRTCAMETEKDILSNINFAKALPGFSDLDLDDKVILLKDAQFEWIFFSFLPLINTEEKLVTCPSCGFTFTMDEAEVIYDDQFDWNYYRCAVLLRPLALTTEELALIKAVCLFNPDGGLWPPKDRQKIGKIQQKYLDALQFVLKKNGRDTAKVLGRIVYSITVMKTCLHWHSTKRENWTTVFPGVKCPELVLEWFGPHDPQTIPDFKHTRLLVLQDLPATQSYRSTLS